MLSPDAVPADTVQSQLERLDKLDKLEKEQIARALPQEDDPLRRRREAQLQDAMAQRRDALAHQADLLPLTAGPQPPPLQPLGLLRRMLRAGCMGLLHPATSPLWGQAFVRRAMQFSAGQISDDLHAGHARRICFFTGDPAHALLDGLVVEPPSQAAPGPRPTMVVVMGFALTYEMAYPQARQFAEQLGLRVLLYNSRGVGRSLGTQPSIRCAIDDYIAAIRYAQRELGARHIGVYGISIGCALGILGTQEMAAQNELLGGQLGLFAGIRGFSSVARVVGAYLGFVGRLIAHALLRAAGLPTLDLEAALRQPLAAQRTVLTAAQDDWLVRGDGQLPQGLRLRPGRDAVLPSGQRVVCVVPHGNGHNDRRLSEPLHDAELQTWATAARQIAAGLPVA